MKETNRTIKVSEHIRLDTRPGSAKWQARVKLADGSWHRFSTKTESIERATEVAMKFFYTSEDRLKNNLPQSTRKFRRVAEFARARMQEELHSGSGHIRAPGSVRRMSTRISLLAQPESMRSIIGATQ